MDLLAQQPAGAGLFDRGARTCKGHGSNQRRGLPPRVRPAPRRPRHIAYTLVRWPTSPHEANPTSRVSAGGEGQPQPPRCSPFGDANGVRLPWAAYLTKSWSEHVERVQVRVAALAERLGGFGTCAPGTWSPRASSLRSLLARPPRQPGRPKTWDCDRNPLRIPTSHHDARPTPTVNTRPGPTRMTRLQLRPTDDVTT